MTKKLCLMCGDGFTVYRCMEIQKFCCRECYYKHRTGDNAPNWRGGKYINTKGYIQIRKPTHPKAQKNGYISEHRLVVEKNIGRYLKNDEVVHHINGNKSDNRLENLELMSNVEHMRLHRNLNGKWAKKYSACVRCETDKIKHAANGLCKRCDWIERYYKNTRKRNKNVDQLKNAIVGAT